MKLTNYPLESLSETALTDAQLNDFLKHMLSPLEAAAVNYNFEPFTYNQGGKGIRVDNVACDSLLTHVMTKLQLYDGMVNPPKDPVEQHKREIRKIIQERIENRRVQLVLKQELQKKQKIKIFKRNSPQFDKAERRLDAEMLSEEYHELLTFIGFKKVHPDMIDRAYSYYVYKPGNSSLLGEVEFIITEKFIEIWCKEGKRGIVPGQQILIESIEFSELKLLLLLKDFFS